MVEVKELYYNAFWHKQIYKMELDLDGFRALLDQYDEEKHGPFGNPRLHTNTKHPIARVLYFVAGVDVREITPGMVKFMNEDHRKVEAVMGHDLSMLYKELEHFQTFEAEVFGRYDIQMTVEDVHRAVGEAQRKIEDSDYRWESWS